MFTVKILFYGLIAFVPDEDGAGMTALVINSPVEHTPVVALLEGTCVGNCPRHNGLGLYWKLTADLGGLEGSTGDDLVFEEPDGPMKGFPTKDNRGDLEWIPRMFHHKNLCSTVRPACIATGCDQAVSRIRIDKGSAASCHFPHHFVDTENRVSSFRFRSGASSTTSQPFAMADTLLVTQTVEGSSLTLRQEGIGYEVRPQNGVVTLLISNSDVEYRPTTQDLLERFENGAAENLVLLQDGGDKNEQGVAQRSVRVDRRRHFSHYYKLSRNRTECERHVNRPIPEWAGEEDIHWSGWPEVQFCESRLAYFETCIPGPDTCEEKLLRNPTWITPRKLEQILQGSHAHQECDLVVFEPPPP